MKYRVPGASGTRLLLWALFWIALGFAASLGVRALVTFSDLEALLSPADRVALRACAGMAGSFAVLLLVARTAGPARSRTAPEPGYGAPAHPWLAAATIGILCFYLVPISMSAMSTFPDQLRAIVGASGWNVALGLLIVVVLAPLAEEVFFRGWLWDGLRLRLGPLGTGTLTSALWLLAHAPQGGLARMILLLPTAIALAFVRHRCGSVRASFAVHVANNAVAVLLPWLTAYWLGWLPA